MFENADRLFRNNVFRDMILEVGVVEEVFMGVKDCDRCLFVSPTSVSSNEV
jgi:hypothetical protein